MLNYTHVQMVDKSEYFFLVRANSPFHAIKKINQHCFDSIGEWPAITEVTSKPYSATYKLVKCRN